MWFNCAIKSLQKKGCAEDTTSEQAENSKRPWGKNWVWTAHTGRDSVLLSAPLTASILVLWQFSSWVLSQQRLIRVNSPFTFVYEGTPLHCLLRPLPLLKSHHHSGRKQGQEWYHWWKNKHATTWLPFGPPGQSHSVSSLQQKENNLHISENWLRRLLTRKSSSLHVAVSEFGVIGFEIHWSTSAGIEYIRFQIFTEAN